MYLNISLVQSQLCGYFSYPFQDDTDCNIVFYNNGLYEIILNKSSTEDLGINTTLSYGKYIYHDSTIICHDQFNGIQMVFVYNPKYIQARKSYFGLMNRKIFKSKYFSVDSRSHPDFLSYEKNRKYKTINEVKGDLLKYNKRIYPFGPCIYDYHDYFTLIINPDNSYCFNFFGTLISKGTWSQKGNELILYDRNIKSNFYSFIIGKDKLICGIIPVVDEDFLMIKKK